ncbi:hypothetical protein BANRA_05508 [Escherichia coli]|nr:hypothetical protein BANRA_05508 [Escherichia coli]
MAPHLQIENVLYGIEIYKIINAGWYPIAIMWTVQKQAYRTIILYIQTDPNVPECKSPYKDIVEFYIIHCFIVFCFCCAGL